MSLNTRYGNYQTMRTWKSKKEFKELFVKKAEVLFEKSVKELSHKEVYQIIATMIKDLVTDEWIQTEKIYNHKRVRQVYYFSIEFLLGRLLNTNLLNCDMENLCRSALQDFGFDLEEISRLTGYHDASHLTKEFRSCIGLTPGQFRERMTTKTDNRRIRR